ncbi:MAG: DUF1553 domain-containing protein [Verrucomicrobiota bacterium]|jgi:hypothetical protein
MIPARAIGIVALACASAATGVLAAGHWAFQPIRHPQPPEVPSLNEPLDRFVAHALRQRGSQLAPPTDRRSWIRRVTMDLTGLPATAEAVAAFVSDDLPDARERVVDGLLADVAYGERWGRWWLDVARYADTNGQDENKVMAHAWRYRDWVVEAMNTDMPFDRFVLDQVAGDLVAAGEPDEPEAIRRRVATGFLVLGPKLLAEQDKPKLVLDIVDEQLDTVGRAFMGLTLGCARCHDHKYDPVPQRDYYAVAGVFRSTRSMENLAFVSKFNERPAATRRQAEAIERHAADLKQAEARLKAATAEADAALARDWRDALPAVLSGDARVEARFAPMVARVEKLRSGAHGAPLRAVQGTPRAAAEALKRWEDALASEGPVPGWRGGAARFHGTNRLEHALPRAATSSSWTYAAWVQAPSFPKKGETRRWLVSTAPNEWADGHLALVLDRDRPGAYANIGGGREKVVAAFGPKSSLQPGRWHHLVAVLAPGRLSVWLDGKEAASATAPDAPLRLDVTVVVGQRADRHVGFEGRMDALRVFDRPLSAAEIARMAAGDDVPGAVVSDDFDPTSPAGLRALADREGAERFLGKDGLLEWPDDNARKAAHDPADRQRVAAAAQDLASLQQRDPGPLPLALAVADDVATNLPVMVRGSHLNPARDPVPRGVLSCIPGVPFETPPSSASGRLQLARWLVHPAHPLTARVLVNRVWQAHFGEGLVRTPENFGLRGEPPTHPDLLDWLASEFTASGWSLKVLHRRIVLSATYGQTSVRAAQEEASGDPDGRWLGRYPRQRLDAEMLRDAILAASGRLDRATGGTLAPWKDDEYVPADPAPFALPRRTVYLPVVRDRGTDLESAFDGANPSVCVARRGTTVVAQQALYLLNAPLVRESADALAAQVLRLSPETRCDGLYQRVLARSPRPSERDRTQRFLSDERLGTLNDAQRWSLVAQALLASNEFTHRE